MRVRRPVRPFHTLFTIPLSLAVPPSAWASRAPAASQSTLPSPIPANCRQLLVARTKSWNSIKGMLQRYERSERTAWRAVGDPTPINVGRSGMGWGRGLHGSSERGPIKREGDGRAPAGAYALGSAFGYAEDLPASAKRFPYLSVRSSTYCIEDPRSAYYNQIVDLTDGTLKGWERRSAMRRPDGLFRWGLIVRQNENETVRGAGSCVFLHIWRGQGRATAGCTAMPEPQVEALLTWLDPSSNPVLVQLPEPEYARLREAWALPD
jgi:L,D-peptidoglycan transpeptidase YkuD (ErfK/YbiS/YcfS/YnhG family)